MRPLPIIDLKDRLICQSQRPVFVGLDVFVYDLPTHGRTACREEACFFIYRPWVGQGELWLTAPELGLTRHPRGAFALAAAARVPLRGVGRAFRPGLATFRFCPAFWRR